MSAYRTNARQPSVGKRLRTRWARIVISPRWALTIPLTICAIGILGFAAARLAPPRPERACVDFVDVDYRPTVTCPHKDQRASVERFEGEVTVRCVCPRGEDGGRP